MSNLGDLHNSSWADGIKQHTATSTFWYQKAAENGDPYGMYILGWKYEVGDGVAISYPNAVHWYYQAARRGNDDAFSGLGGMYLSGKGVTQDFSMAAFWYKRAVLRGNVKAMLILGDLYAEGKGVPRDLRVAKSLYTMARRTPKLSIWQGEAKGRLERLEQQTDTGDIIAGVLIVIGAYLVADYFLGGQSNTSSGSQNGSDSVARDAEQQRQKVRKASWETNCRLNGRTPVGDICM